MSGVAVTQQPANSWMHAVGDPKPPTRYAVTTVRNDVGVLLGYVESSSEPNMVKPKGLRYTTGQRGFSRSWRATCAAGHDVGRFYRRRQSAIDGLVEHAAECRR